jgi:hypothetical protein
MSITLALAAAAAVLGALGVVPQLSERRRARRVLRRYPLLTASAKEGAHVRVLGVVRVFERTLVAPISARACVAHWSYARIAGAPGNGVRSQIAHPSRVELLALAPFVVDCGPAGTVLVDGDHARFDVPKVKLTDADAERKRRFMMLHGFTSVTRVTASFHEIVIEPGMTVAVAGVMMRDVAHVPPSSEIAFREGPAPTIRLSGNEEHPLVISATKIPLALTSSDGTAR